MQIFPPELWDHESQKECQEELKSPSKAKKKLKEMKEYLGAIPMIEVVMNTEHVDMR